MRISDLPEFSSIANAHENVVGEVEGYEGDEGETGIRTSDQPLARHWIDGLPKGWAGTLEGAPYVAPLSEIVRRIGALSGVACPELDATEGPLVHMTVMEGFDGEG